MDPHLWRRLLGSAASAVAGWVCGFLGLGGIGIVATIVFDRSSLSELWSQIWWPFLFAFGFVLPLWLLFLLPLYLFIPSNSVVWRCWPCIFVALCVGAVIGAIRLALVGALGDTDLFLFTVESALIGGFACLFAVLSRRWLHGTQTVLPIAAADGYPLRVHIFL
jgi:hypothetical protein